METAKLWGIGILHTVVGFVLAGAMFREYINHYADVPAFIPEKYFYRVLGVAAIYCLVYTLSIPSRSQNKK